MGVAGEWSTLPSLLDQCPLLHLVLLYKHLEVIKHCAFVCAKSLQLCPTFCDPIHCRPPGSSVHGILQARVLEWVAMPSSKESSQPGTEPGSPASQADSLPSQSPEEAHYLNIIKAQCNALRLS